MPDRRLKVTIRTPTGTVLEIAARSVRVPTETGHVGLRPRCEASHLPIEAGVVLVHADDGTRFVGTAGGLSICDGAALSLLTPVAVVGNDAADIAERLARMLERPTSELEIRSLLDGLEQRIVDELRNERRARFEGGAPG